MSYNDYNDYDGYETYAVPIKFEGEITIPCSDPKIAEVEVRKAVSRMCEPYEVWGDHRDPSWNVWWDGGLYERRI